MTEMSKRVVALAVEEIMDKLISEVKGEVINTEEAVATFRKEVSFANRTDTSFYQEDLDTWRAFRREIQKALDALVDLKISAQSADMIAYSFGRAKDALTSIARYNNATELSEEVRENSVEGHIDYINLAIHVVTKCDDDFGQYEFKWYQECVQNLYHAIRAAYRLD